VGAAPPFGHLYGLSVYISEALSHRAQVTFNAGSHDTAVRMKYLDFEKLAAGRVLDLSISPLEGDT
jgi:Ala-tRNA(Pro) deacylase